jgi:hypothetical protein
VGVEKPLVPERMSTLGEMCRHKFYRWPASLEPGKCWICSRHESEHEQRKVARESMEAE